MCTLSWQWHQNELNIVFSRDEQLSRAKAEPPRIERVAGTNVVAPTDPQGGGYWLSSNEHGLTLCLLNDYGSPQPEPGQTHTSRGQLVKQLSALSTPALVRKQLISQHQAGYAPCFLFAFWQQRAPILWHWNGKTWAEHCPNAPFFSTSSLFPNALPAFRRWLFMRNQIINHGWGEIAKHTQLALHRQRLSALPWASIAMRRKTRATVSLTRITIGQQHTTMDYWPGDPTLSEQQRSFSITLQRHGPALPAHAVNSQARAIDVPALLADKNPTLYHKLKGLPMRLLCQLVGMHQVNQALRHLPTQTQLTAEQFPQRVLNRLGVSVSSALTRNLPKAEARPVFVANHPTGGLDGLILLAWLQQFYPSVKVVVTDLLTHIEPLNPLLVPVNRYQSSHHALRNLTQAFAGDDALLLFPAGRTARMQQGQLTEFNWNSMPEKLAKKTQRSIVPLHLQGQNSGLFYAIAKLRSALGIELNLEMLLLARELMNPATRHFRLTVGPTIDHDSINEGCMHQHYEQLTTAAEPNTLALRRNPI